MSRYSNEDLEEERRLCYVGITRPKKELYLSCANSRMLFGQTKHNRPSRFLEEIDASLVEVEQSPAAAQTKAMRQRYMQQQNAYLQPEYGAASMRSTVQAGYSARYGRGNAARSEAVFERVLKNGKNAQAFLRDGPVGLLALHEKVPFCAACAGYVFRCAFFPASAV